MTTAAIPTGRPGTAPRGPAGPHPEPNRPGTPTRPAEPPKPSSPAKGALDCIDLLLRTCQVVADLKLPELIDPAMRMALVERLRLARRSVADLEYFHSSGRDGKAVSGDGGSRPVQHPAGRPPLPGGAPGPRGFLLPRDVRILDRPEEAFARRAD